MKINQVNQYGVNPYQKAVNKADTSMKPSQLADKVEISSQAKEMQNISSVTVERQAKIDEIKMQIENGTYQMNVNETAKSVFNFYSQK